MTTTMHLVFDWDGTIAKKEVAEEASLRRGNSLGIHFKPDQLRELQKTHGHYEINKDAIRKYTGITDDRLLTMVMTNLFQLHYLGVVNEWRENIFYENMLKVLQRLKKQHSLRYSIATTLRQDIVEPALQVLGITFLDRVYGNTPDLRYSKLDLVKQALNDCGDVHLVIGDRLDDLQAGKEVAAKTAYATWGHGTEDVAGMADFVLERPEDLTMVMEKLRKH